MHANLAKGFYTPFSGPTEPLLASATRVGSRVMWTLLFEQGTSTHLPDMGQAQVLCTKRSKSAGLHCITAQITPSVTAFWCRHRSSSRREGRWMMATGQSLRLQAGSRRGCLQTRASLPTPGKPPTWQRSSKVWQRGDGYCCLADSTGGGLLWWLGVQGQGRQGRVGRCSRGRGRSRGECA